MINEYDDYLDEPLYGYDYEEDWCDEDDDHIFDDNDWDEDYDFDDEWDY